MAILLFAMGVSYHGHISFRVGRELSWPFFLALVTLPLINYMLHVIVCALTIRLWWFCVQGEHSEQLEAQETVCRVRKIFNRFQQAIPLPDWQQPPQAQYHHPLPDKLAIDASECTEIRPYYLCRLPPFCRSQCDSALALAC